MRQQTTQETFPDTVAGLSDRFACSAGWVAADDTEETLEGLPGSAGTNTNRSFALSMVEAATDTVPSLVGRGRELGGDYSGQTIDIRPYCSGRSFFVRNLYIPSVFLGNSFLIRLCILRIKAFLGMNLAFCVSLQVQMTEGEKGKDETTTDQ